MIDIKSEAALARIESLRRDIEHADVAGFMPAASDIVGPRRVVGERSALAVVAPEGAYFASVDERGVLAFGRDGRFALRDGILRAPDGRAVLGFPAGSRAPAPIRIDPHDIALGGIADPRIERDGSLTYGRVSVDPRSGDRHRAPRRHARERRVSGTRHGGARSRPGRSACGLATAR